MRIVPSDGNQIIKGSVLINPNAAYNAAPAVPLDVVGAANISGDLAVTGNAAVTGVLSTSNTANATTTTDGPLCSAGGLSVAKNAVIGGDIYTGQAEYEYGASSTVVGITNLSKKIVRIKAVGKRRFVDFYFVGVGNTGTAVTFTVPDAAKTITNMSWVGFSSNTDASADLTPAGMVLISSASSTVHVYTNFAAAAWSNSVGSRGAAGHVEYEAA